MAYDGYNERVVEIEDESYAGDREVYHKLYLYKENMEYTLDLKTRKCNKTKPRHDFHPYGVPDDSKFVAEGTIGIAGKIGESVNIAVFDEQMTFPNHDGNTNSALSHKLGVIRNSVGVEIVAGLGLVALAGLQVQRVLHVLFVQVQLVVDLAVAGVALILNLNHTLIVAVVGH